MDDNGGDVLTFLQSPDTVGSKTFHPGPDGIASIDYSAPFGPFRVIRAPVTDLDSAAAVLLQCPPNAFLIRGSATADIIPYRRKKDRDGMPATLESAAHRLLPIDIDADSDGMDGRDVLACATAWRARLPAEFHGAKCFAFGSSSAGKPMADGRPGGSKLRLYFWCDRPVDDSTAAAWVGDVGDDHIYQPHQPIYVAAPRFDGMADFLGGRPRAVMLDGDPVVRAPESVQTRTRKAPTHAVMDVLPYSAAITHGGRNSTLTSIAGAMRRKGMEADAIAAGLLAHNETFTEPLDESEVRKIADSIANYEPEAPATAAVTVSTRAAETVLRKQSERLAQDPGLLADAAAKVAEHVRAGTLTETQAISVLWRGIAKAEVTHGLTKDSIQAALQQAPMTLPATKDLPHWAAACILNDDGNPIPCPENLRIALSLCPDFALWWNARSQQDHWTRCPWHAPGPVLPTDDFALRAWLSRNLGWHKCPAEPLAAIAEVARHNPYDPWKAWLETLQWDGVRRLAKVAPVLLGTDPSPANRLMFAWWLISAVARSFQPGCQVDHVLVLEGPQGEGKTTFLRELAMDAQFFTRFTAAGDLHSPRAIGKIHGPVIVELAELAAMKRTESEGMKAFADERFDRVQWLYSKKPVDVGRTCVFAATTNEGQYLRDLTGARRWWALRCGRIRIDVLLAVREQLWAEAVHLYRRGVKWYPTKHQARRLGLIQLQEARRETEFGEEHLTDALAEVRVPGRNPLTGLNIAAEQLDHAGRIVRMTVSQAAEMCNLHPSRDAKALTRTLRALGWERSGRVWEAPDAGQRGTYVAR